MNWKLIFQLSLFGLAMAIATVFWIPSNTEPYFWLVIFIVCAYIIAKQVSSRHFLHGFFTSLVNCVWVTGFHVIFFKTYLAGHPQEIQMMDKMHIHGHTRLLMLLMGPVAGVVFGLVLGLFAWIASKLVRKSSGAGIA
ncbi:hypothetical protein [Puia dinghuensis]|uniref:Uncharacterized protein n=1 Tax=Puia dinghuensis TaxID=1792502 RepID=A0A8J2UDS3_9BACT|nr:hypothetical protein [Puia dinghuensis]GGB03796.1 hypothetical protein GCM10011511_28900 [Puia dinghuensis]